MLTRSIFIIFCCIPLLTAQNTVTVSTAEELIKAIGSDKTIYLHAQLRAIPFYARHGFEKTGPQFSECNIEHFKMIFTK